MPPASRPPNDGTNAPTGFGRLPAPLQWGLVACLSVLTTVPLEAAGFPAALLMGPMLAGIFVALGGGSIRLPRIFFFAVQVVLALIIATMVSQDFVGTFLENWPLMLLVVVSVISVSTLSGWLIARTGILPGTTAIWGSSAGAASTMMIMAEAYGADARLVAFMQYLRVVFVASFATLVAHFGGHDGAAMPPHAWFEPVPMLPLAAMLAVGILAGLAGQKLRIPAGAFLVPFALASVLNSSGTVTIVLPQWLLVIAFTLLGWNIGLGFTRAILLHARRALLPTVASIIALISFSGLLAGLLILVLGIDPLTAYLATSPGGLDSIAVIAASSKVDVAFVMTLQTARLILVTLIGPWLARFLADRS
ncbi:AbrB family transcriptional regulator [Shinella zoogloeoides]|uniref:AbrB family transcriptional regulator n=1 Tax=Shinella zoogloeoides TaxID=352475 RepID=UPI00273FFB38|nr:AbrB family transcriptional regulator [Shinella zoogloeoides]WLR91068.1 AbrB family transcriptional regulator [Shinella zoogloeoides]